MPFMELHYFSHALGMQTAANVILPDGEAEGPFEVMFLLHGLSDDHTIWARRTSIERYVEGLPLIVVMPNGGRGFYTDAVSGLAYETAIAGDLAGLVRRFLPVKERWCVTGLSMGGYGAARLALRFPKVFASAASHSGAMDFGHWPEYRPDTPEEFKRILGESPAGGPNDLYALASGLKKSERPRLRFDCGVDDFLIEANRGFHNHLAALGYKHEYAEFPGDHSWAYWDEHVQEAIAFHRKSLGF
jgi:S-formylglutathione hydrolase FrmB